jgi:predicted permease
MNTLLGDLRHGVRQLVQRPGFAAAAIASLALGIGLNVTLFSVVNGVLLRDTAIAEPNRLVEIYSGLSKDFPQLTTSYPDFLDIKHGANALSGVAGNSYVRGILSTGARPVLVTGEAVTDNYFDVLGVRPALGRGFRPDENAVRNAVPVAVVSHGLWQRSLGGRSDILGTTMKLSGLEYTIVGVAPANFTGTIPGIPTEFWVPVMMVDRLVFSGVQANSDNEPDKSRVERRGHRWLFVKGRLAEGRTIEEARAQIETIYARLSKDYPATNDKVTTSVVPVTSIRFHPMLDGYVRAASAGLLGAVGLVLLIACANVANLLLARAAARRREFAIRAAVGASRARIVRQLLSEGAVLASIGGALGVVIAWWASRALTGFGTGVFPIPVNFDFSIDRTVLIFAVGVSAVTAFLFGLAPAWSSSRPELVPALKASIEGNERRRFALRDVIVVAQLAMSLVLLVAGALLARGLLAAKNTDLGYDPRPVSSLQFNLQMNGYDTPRGDALRKRALEALQALPGVTAASTASRLPLSPDINMDGLRVAGHHAETDEETPTDAVSIGADYFKVTGIPIVAGRAFTSDDIENARRVAIVNETLARQYWPKGNAVGSLIYSGSYKTKPYEIVGIARDHKVRSVGEDPRPYFHVPSAPSASINLIVRTTTPPQTALPMLRQALWSIEPDIVFTEDVPAEEVAAATIAPTRIGAIVVGAFGALALLLAGVGLYGVIAYSVSRRTREVGIRMALGAERGTVLRMILGQGGRLALIGIALGAIAAAGVGQILQSMLYGVSTVDPIAYAGAAAMLLVVTVAANFLPALAAARIDPVRALRSE